MGHTGLVAHEGGKVDLLLRVILGESLAAASVASCTLLGQVAQRAVAGSLEFTVRLGVQVSRLENYGESAEYTLLVGLESSLSIARPPSPAMSWLLLRQAVVQRNR